MAHLRQHRHLKIRNQLRFGGFGLIIGTLFLLMWGCAKHETATTPTPQASPADQGMTKVAQTSSATLAEANEAVTRVFRNAATIDANHEPNFFTGDFNGDDSQDIAVILKPEQERLAEINQEFPAWILKDPLSVPNRPAPPLRIAANDVLLAIIHGYGPNGWRDAQATQTYLLKNAVGLDVKAYPKSDFASADQGKKLPRLSGDLIGQNLGGKSGYLYFTGAQYAWYDPKTFKGEPEIRVTHPGMVAKKKKFDLLHPNLVAAEK
jgi:hypothetical protein